MDSFGTHITKLLNFELKLMANNNNNNRAPVKKKYGENKAKRAIKYKRVVGSHYKRVMGSQILIYRIYNFFWCRRGSRQSCTPPHPPSCWKDDVMMRCEGVVGGKMGVG